MATSDLRVTYTNNHSGIRTVALTPPAEQRVRAFLATQGLTLEDTARKGRRNAHGLFTFRCGVGYAVVDADLLGGSGDGAQERAFWEHDGRSLTWR